MPPGKKKRRNIVIMSVVFALMITPSCAKQKNEKHSKNQDEQKTERISENKDTENFENKEYVQWYLDNSEEFMDYTNELAWGMDQEEAKEDIDISYKEGMENFSGKREVNIAVIDSKEEHGERIINILKNGNIDNSYKSLCDDECFKTFLIDVDYKKLDDKKIIEAIDEAERDNASICVMAFAGMTESEELKKRIRESDMLFVTAAGNDGVELGKFKVYPAMYGLDNVLVVGDERCDGKISELSNYSRKYVDIIAPGTDIACIDEKGEHYESGSSYACAIAAGVCAIVKAGSDKEFNNVKLKQFICDLSKADNDTNDVVRYGRINCIGDYLQTN